MAKAKKPASGSKSSSRASAKPADVKAKIDGAAPASAAASEAFVSKRVDAKPDPAASASSVSKATTSASEPASVAAKNQTAVTSDATSTDTKPVSRASKAVTAKADTSKSAAAKPEPAKSEPTKAEAAKPSAVKNEPTKPEASKPVTPTTTTQQHPAPQPVEESSTGFWPLVFGGLIAAGLGFAASQFGLFNTQPEPQAAFDPSGIETSLGTQQEQITALEASVNEVASREPATVEGEAVDLSGIETSIAALSETVTALETRLAALENRPEPVANNDSAALEAAAAAAAEKYTAELAALQASVEGQKSEIDRLLDNALSVEEATAQAAQQAAVLGALTKITSALGTGEGFSDAVDELSAAGVSDIPTVLSETAEGGVATLLSLQSDFPDTARAALSTARASGAGDGEGGLGGFLKRQLGARSVAPREGSDPDAVLSRAEAAVRSGSIADALAEIDALPADAQDAMATWRASAQARADAAAAVEDLSQRLTAN